MAALRQVVTGEYDHTGNAAGNLRITDDNWDTTYRVPLLAAVDHRVDNDVENISLTIKMVVNGETVNNTKLQVGPTD